MSRGAPRARPVALIVESGSTRGALAGARGLQEAGWRVHVGSPDRGSLATWSRSTSGWDPVPYVGEGVEPFLAGVAAAVARRRADVVFPAGDAETLALVRGRDRIGATLPYGRYEDVRRAFDKLDLTRAAGRAGLRAPWTVPATREALGRADLPVVVKSRLHWSPEGGGRASRLEAELCKTREQAADLADAMRAAGGEPLLQEVIAGLPMSFYCVVDRHGRLVASVGQLGSRRFFPPAAGRRTRSCSVAPDPELERRVEGFLGDLVWTGFAGLSFLLDADGVPRLIDFNGRLPLTLDASAAAGVNLMVHWGEVALGRDAGEQAVARAGARWHWLEGDLKRAVRERRGGLAADLGETLRFASGAHHTLIRADDPMPLLRQVALLGARRGSVVAGRARVPRRSGGP